MITHYYLLNSKDLVTSFCWKDKILLQWKKHVENMKWPGLRPLSLKNEIL